MNQSYAALGGLRPLKGTDAFVLQHHLRRYNQADAATAPHADLATVNFAASHTWDAAQAQWLEWLPNPLDRREVAVAPMH